MSNITIVKSNQKIEDVVSEKLAQFMEDVAKLYGIDIHIEDTDWQTVYDLKSILFDKMEELGVKIEY